MPSAKDLFDESSMSFGEHLESLRARLIWAIIGLVVCVGISLTFGNEIITFMSAPISEALKKHGIEQKNDLKGVHFWEDTWNSVKQVFSKDKKTDDINNKDGKELGNNSIKVMVSPREIAETMHDAYPTIYPAPPEEAESKEKKDVEWTFSAKEFRSWNKVEIDSHKPKTFNVQEAFLTYLKVALVSGFILASPWIFYQLWLFVAAGLYSHERKYVYIYMPASIGLFLLGAFFCFQWVLPLVLDFLLSFNKAIGVQPAIRLSEYISFAIMLPAMFGLSFQLPLVMLLLERIHIMSVKTYREKRRMAILIIAIVSMLMTPSDPMSMLMMLIPLCLLYELGIWMCKMAGPKKNPFDEIAAT